MPDKLNDASYAQEDEIDLKELFQTIMAGKKTIFMTMIVVISLTLVFVLKTPNVYKSNTILIPTADGQSPSLGGLGGLAAMAGVSIGGAGSMTPDTAFSSLLNSYDFMRRFVLKNKIYEHYSSDEYDKNFVFALGYNGVYNLFKSTKDKDEIVVEDEIFKLIKSIQKKFSISADKKTALITISYSDSDRTYPPKIINAFLKDASSYLVKNNLKNIDDKLSYFQKELNQVEAFELRQSISIVISKIVQEKVMMKSKQYYQCDVLTQATASYIKDKSKPKRGLIMVVSFITSIILGIFLVFFLSFLRQEK